jgi:peroxiredoxin Q/BCP
MLNVGQSAPVFELPDADMNLVRLSEFRGKQNVVLYFYPKDDTPGCTTEAIEFSDLQVEFDGLNTVVIGVSRDDCFSHGAFRDKHGLSVCLLADTDAEVCEHYGVMLDREVEGKGKKRCLQRSTFIIDKQGVLRHAFYGVNPRRHAAEILNRIRKLG